MILFRRFSFIVRFINWLRLVEAMISLCKLKYVIRTPVFWHHWSPRMWYLLLDAHNSFARLLEHLVNSLKPGYGYNYGGPKTFFNPGISTWSETMMNIHRYGDLKIQVATLKFYLKIGYSSFRFNPDRSFFVGTWLTQTIWRNRKAARRKTSNLHAEGIEQDGWNGLNSEEEATLQDSQRTFYVPFVNKSSEARLKILWFRIGIRHMYVTRIVYYVLPIRRKKLCKHMYVSVCFVQTWIL